MWGLPLAAEALRELLKAEGTLNTPELSEQQRSLLEQLDQQAAKSERYWSEQLCRLEQSQLPDLPSVGGDTDHSLVSIELPSQLRQESSWCKRAGLILSLFAQAWSDVFGQPSIAVALLGEEACLSQLQRPWSQLFCDWVPLWLASSAATPCAPLASLRQGSQAVAEQLEKAQRHPLFRTDLIGRRRRLRELRGEIASLPEGIVVSRGSLASKTGKEAHPALAIALPSGPEGHLHMRVDLNRIQPEPWDLLQSRLQALLHEAAALRLPTPSPSNQRVPHLDAIPSIRDRFKAIASADPERLALVDGDRQLSYGRLLTLAGTLAQEIRHHCGDGDGLIALMAERRSEIVLAMVACLLAQRAFVVLDPFWPQSRQDDCFEQLGHVPLLTTATCRHGINPASRICSETLCFEVTPDWQYITLTPYSSEQDLHSEQPPPAGLAYVIFTSGSTGRPKPVAIECHSLDAFAVLMAETYQLCKSDRVLQFAAQTFDACIEEIFPSLAAGASICCRTETSIASARQFLRFLDQNKITVVSLPTAFWADLTQTCWQEQLKLPSSLRLVILGGEAVSVSHLRIWEAIRPAGIQLVNTYGPTEATVEVTLQNLSRSWQYRHSVPIGRPLQTAEVRVLDGNGQPCPIGIPGELHIGGAGLARGYLNNPELTAEKFIPDPYSLDPKARLYKSGDLASWNPDGTLLFHGRIDQQIKLRGYRIEPGEIEANLLAHPAIAQAAVLLRHDDPANPRLIAYWVPQQLPAQPPLDASGSSAPLTNNAASSNGNSAASSNGDESSNETASALDPLPSQQLRSFLGERLPDYMVPSAFIALDALPLTANGKLDRKALPAPSFAGDLEQRIPPSNELERQLHDLWAEVLGHSDFGVTDNFFLVGGHSLAAARLVSRIEQAFGTAPPLAALFQSPSIAGLVPLVVPHQDRSEPPAARQPIPAAEPLAGDWPPGCQAFQASFAQARLWFLHQLKPQLCAYHLPFLWRLQGDLDIASLQQALTALIERHPTLRTSFHLVGDEVVQLLHPSAPFPLRPEPLDGRDPEALIDTWLDQEATTPFDLSSGLLLRARLLQLAQDQHVLLLNHHHIASDGWSLSLLTRDLTALYNARRTGQPSPLQSLPVHYHDYAAWQRQRLSGSRLRVLQRHWIEALTGLQPLELPSDSPRPATPSYRGGQVAFTISAAQLQPFEALCRCQGATLQMGLLALLALLLHRISRQDDLAIGVPIWGRNHPDLESLIGFFVNTLPIRTRYSPQLSFRQFLDQVKTTSIAAYDHQELPFEQMVEALQPERDRSRNPLAQVLLQLFEPSDAAPRHLAGLHGQPLPASGRSSRFDLEVFLWRSPDDSLRGTISFATDLFDADRIERLSAQLLTLLAAATATPDAPAATLELLPEAERTLIETWQQGPRIELPDLCVHQLFERQVELSPDAIALVFGDQQLSYAELNARANQLADHLIAHGVGPEVIVAVCLERSIELIVALLAILKAGGAYLPLDPAWPHERIQQLLRDGDEPWLLIDADPPSSLGWDRCITVPLPQTRGASTSSAVAMSDVPEVLPRAQLDHAAYLLFTSGSTGRPKGVLVEHRALASRCQSLASHLDLQPGQRVLALTTAVFDIAIVELLITLAHGATIVLASEAQRKDPAGVATLVHSHGVQVLQATPSALDALLTAGFRPTAAMLLLAGGEPLTDALAQGLTASGPRLVNGYGPTEACIYTTLAPIQQGQVVSIGRPIAATLVCIRDRNGQSCPIGIPGELLIGGAGLARGYRNNPELTAEKFIPDPYSLDPTARLYKSGDLASWNPDGTLAFHGRIDQQIKLRGYRIEPGEIEANLLAH
ncbi:MAG: amino acid adenylation domain-containing protein, partial [Cyanobium sp.]